MRVRCCVATVLLIGLTACGDIAGPDADEPASSASPTVDSFDAPTGSKSAKPTQTSKPKHDRSGTRIVAESSQFGPMLFDTGYSQRFFDATRQFPYRLYRHATPVTLREDELAINQLSTLNLRPSDITRIFISHFHADHISALLSQPAPKGLLPNSSATASPPEPSSSATTSSMVTARRWL